MVVSNANLSPLPLMFIFFLLPLSLWFTIFMNMHRARAAVQGQVLPLATWNCIHTTLFLRARTFIISRNLKMCNQREAVRNSNRHTGVSTHKHTHCSRVVQQKCHNRNLSHQRPPPPHLSHLWTRCNITKPRLAINSPILLALMHLNRRREVKSVYNFTVKYQQ